MESPEQRQAIFPRSYLPFMLAFIADVILATGIIPAQRSALVRAAVMYTCYQQWVLALLSGFVLPRFMPLIAVCFLRDRWVAFWRSAPKQVEAMAKELASRIVKANEAASGGPEGTRTCGGGPLRRSEEIARYTTEEGRSGTMVTEVTGYDVSNVSGDEVVELSSWTNVSPPTHGGGPGIRRRGVNPPR